MPIIKSARKRVKVAAKANLRNVRTKRTMREAIKAYSKALAGGKASEILEAERKAVSTIDLATKRAVIHKNKAARQKAALAAKTKAAGAKSVKKAKPPAKKAVTPKKTAKSTLKKPVAKPKK